MQKNDNIIILGIFQCLQAKIFLMLEHMPLSKYPRFVLWRAPLQFPTLKPAAFIAIPLTDMKSNQLL